MSRGRLAVRQELFDEIRALFEGGDFVKEIACELGLGVRRVERWVRRIELPELSTKESKPCTPAHFGTSLKRPWAEGVTKVRHLLAEIRNRGYARTFGHLARLLAPSRRRRPPPDAAEPEELAPVLVRTIDPMTRRVNSPLTAAALCVKPRAR